VTLNDPERRNGPLILRYFTEFAVASAAHCVRVVEDVVVKKFTFASSSPDVFLVYNPAAIPIFIPAPIFGIERVSSVKLLGVYSQENFSCDMHFKHIITVSR